MTGKNSYYKRQIWLILAGAALPAFVELLYWLKLSVIPDYQLTAVSFTLGFSLIGWSFFGYKFLRIVPVARSMVIEQISDIMIVVNTEGNILDINKSCQDFFRFHNMMIIGKAFTNVFTHYPELIAIFKHGQEGEIRITVGNKQYYFVGSTSLISNPIVEPIAEVVLLHNITTIRETTLQLRESEENTIQFSIIRFLRCFC